jgi:hypothetical protein
MALCYMVENGSDGWFNLCHIDCSMCDRYAASPSASPISLNRASGRLLKPAITRTQSPSCNVPQRPQKVPRSFLTRPPRPPRSLRSLTRRSVEEEFPHLYAHGCTLRDVCAECTKFVADVISSSRRSLDLLNTPKRESRPAARRPQAAPLPRPLSAPCPWGAPSQPPPSASRRQPLARADATLPNRAGK